ncbi:hypothetical protein ACHAXT_001656 [Thalassiosira profunda]
MHRKSGRDNKKVGPLSEMIAAHRRGENGLIRTPKIEGVRTDAEDDGNGDGSIDYAESDMLKSPPEQMAQSQPPPRAEKLSFEQRLQLQHDRLRHNEGAAAPVDTAKAEPSGTPKPPPEQSINRFASGNAMNAPQSPVLVPTKAGSAAAQSPSSLRGSPYAYSGGESKGVVNAADDSGRSGRSERRGRRGTDGGEEDWRRRRSPPPPPCARAHEELAESKERKRSGVLTAAAALTGMGHGQAHSPTTGVVGLGRSLEAMAVDDHSSDGDEVTSSPQTQSPKTESSASTVSRDNNRVSKPLEEEVERSHKKEKSRRRRKSDASSSLRRSSTTAAPMPSGAKRAIARCRGGEALPREGVVSDVVQRLLSRNDREMGNEAKYEDGGEKSANSFCVAVLPPSAADKETVEPLEDRGSGIGKTTIAALACAHGDVRTRYHHGIAWIDMHRRPLGFDFLAYSKALAEICRQIGINPQKLQLNPIVRSPAEDEKVVGVRMRDQMEEARNRMGKLLTSLHRHSKTSKKESSPSVLVVLDDVAQPSDIHWFQFHRSGKEHRVQINDLLVTSRTNFPGASVVAVPPLETKEAVRLLLTEADLPGNHPLAKSRIARGLVKKDCLFHPLITKYAGRWLGLKCATSGGQKGMDALLGEIHSAIKEGLGSGDKCNSVEVLSALLSKAMSPLVKGQATTIIRLCFAAFVAVFYPTATPADALEVPLQLAGEFFLKVVESEKIAREDAFFQSNGRQASRIVPEILAALAVFDITQPAQLDSTIQIEHALVRQYAKHILLKDEAFRSLGKNPEIRWNETFVLSYFEGKACTWDDVLPNLSRRYALERMPGHMLRGEMLGDLDALMCNTSFIRGRFWALGWSEGTKAHINDAESFCNCLIAKGEGDDGSSKMVGICGQLEAVLMEEVARESGGPNGRCSTLEAGRCLHEISLSLSRFQLWDEAARFSNSCVELVESNLGASDLVASLLYNNDPEFVRIWDRSSKVGKGQKDVETEESAYKTKTEK